ncbi:MAG: MFS transporter [Chloroflexota bacterium]
MDNQPSIKNRPLRWVLQLDKPIKILNQEEAKAAQSDNFLWNLIFNSFDVVFFMGGISVLSATTILPLFVSKLTDSTIPIALVAMISQGGFFLPQLFTANFIERLHHKKPVVVSLGFWTERLPALLLIVAPLIALQAPMTALVSFLLIYAWFNLGGGVIAPAWQDMVARCFPVERRGRFFGSTMFLGALIGVGAASVAGRVLDEIAFPNNFLLIFAVAGGSIFLSWVFIAQTREPIEAADVPELTIRQYLAELPSLLRRDTNFRNFLVARFVLAIAELGSGFLTVAAIQIWGIADSMVATFTTAMLIGQTTGSLLMGFLADRYGHRLSLEISAITAVFAFGLAWLSPNPTWFVAVFFLLGFFNGARIVSGLMVVLEFAQPEKRPTYVGITNTLSGIGSIIAPLLGALLVLVGFDWVFLASMIASLIAVLMLRFWVKEPRFTKSS